MNDAQTWTGLSILATALLGVLAYAVRMVEHKFAAVDQRFDRMDQRFDRVEDRFDRFEAKIDARLDGIDRDIIALTRRHFGDS